MVKQQKTYTREFKLEAVQLVKSSEIHPLLRRPETFGPAHQLFISNRAKIARRRGTRMRRTS